MGNLLNPEKGTWVLLCFIGFFAVVVAVNAVYITAALSTHSGVITDKPYEKGLAYDEALEQAKTQPKLIQKATFENGTLRWILKDKDNVPIMAEVTARLVRSVQSGYDFDIELIDKGNGVYESALDFPLNGNWEAQLKAQWETSQYKTRLTFMVQ